MNARYFWISGFLTAALLLALEIGSRLVGFVEFPDPLLTEQRPDWRSTREYDRLLFWRMQAGIQREGEPLTNRLGLRGPEVEPKAPGEFRILSLGESTTFGIRLPFEETYSARLEDRLSAGPQRSVRVINAGVPGYSLFQGLAYLRHRGLQLDPDAVLIYFGFNDFLPISFRLARDAAADQASGGLSDRELFEQRQELSFRLVDALARQSNLVRYLLFETDADLPVMTDDSRVRVPEDDRRRLLAELRDLADANDLRLAIIVPWYREFEDHTAVLREFAAQENVPLVDLPKRLVSLPRARSEYFVDELHPNAAGHELIATHLADELGRAWGLRDDMEIPQ